MTSRSSAGRYQAATATPRRSSLGYSAAAGGTTSSGIGSSYGAGTTSSYGGYAGSSGYRLGTSYVPSSAAVANALSNSSAAINNATSSTFSTSNYLNTTVTASPTTSALPASGGVGTGIGGAAFGLSSPSRRHLYSSGGAAGAANSNGNESDTSLNELLLAAGCTDPAAITGSAPRYGHTGDSPASPVRPAPLRYRGARSNQELSLSSDHHTTSAATATATTPLYLQNGRSTTNLDSLVGASASSALPPSGAAAAAATSSSSNWRSRSLTSQQQQQQSNDLDSRPYSRSRSRLDSEQPQDEIIRPYSRSRSRLDDHHPEPEPAYYKQQQQHQERRTSATPVRERPPRSAPVETMYGDSTQVSSPVRDRNYRTENIRDYELVYTPHDGPTSARNVG